MDLVNGKLSPFLISEYVLHSTLEDVQILLQTKYARFKLMIHNVKDVYSYCKFLYTRNGTQLYVTLKIPISHLVPVPINSTSKDATQLLDLPEYFAVIVANQHYITLDRYDLQHCTGSHTISCSGNFALSPVTSLPCVLALCK